MRVCTVLVRNVERGAIGIEDLLPSLRNTAPWASRFASGVDRPLAVAETKQGGDQWAFTDKEA